MRKFAGRIWAQWPRVKFLPLVIFFTLIGYFYYLWHLGTLTAGLGPAEYISRQLSQSAAAIVNNGLNAPYYLLQHFMAQIFGNGYAALRISSVAVALVIFICLIILLRQWFGKTSALLGGLVFISTGWLIVLSRNATPLIMYLWPAVLILFYIRTTRSKTRAGAWWLGLCVVAALAFYIPGMVWLMVAGAVLQRRSITFTSRRLSAPYFVGGLSAAILLVLPLVQALVARPWMFKNWLLVPANFAPLVLTLKSIGWSALALIWQAPAHMDTIVGRLPILTLLQIALVVFGIYALQERARRLCFYLIGLIAFSIIAAGVNFNNEILALGLVSIGVFMAAGLRFLYLEWRRVFPYNPFSYGLAMALIIVVVAAQMFYGARYGLVAWPHTPATRGTYVLK